MPSSLRACIILAATVATAALTTACGASRSAGAGESGRCRGSAVDSMFLGNGPVYAACEVDSEATALGRPFIAPPTVSIGRLPQPGCERVEIEFVVDEAGVPATERIRNVTYTSTELLNVVREAVGTMRYKPAVKDGRPVKQVVRYRISRAITVSAAGGGRPRPPRC